VAINVIVADQERAFADVLAARLDEEDDIEVSGAVQVPAPGSSLPGEKSADVLLLDADLPDDAANRLCDQLSGGGRPETAEVIRLLIWGQDKNQKNQLLLSKLTARERAVLACLAEGAAHRGAVAEQLHLSVHTVRTHMQNLMAKLGVHSMLEAVALTRDDAGSYYEDGTTSS
jgi:DNA-binding NarL/FixJ family response regulator